MTYIAASREALADAIGAMPEASNVFDITDEATTMITAPVDEIADALIASGAIVAADSLADDLCKRLCDMEGDPRLFIPSEIRTALAIVIEERAQ